MIKIALSYIKDALNTYLGAPPNIVVLGNIAFAQEATGDNPPMKNQVVISLVNVEEDKISKDPLPYRHDGANIYFQQPAVHLNLNLLFSANFENYEDALTALGKVVEFFQQKSYYTPENTTNLPAGIDKLLFDLFNISQDQVHHLWSMLGGKYIPSVVYRLRMLTIWQLQETPAGIIRKVKMKDNVL